LEMAPYQDQVVTHFPWKRTANSPETANWCPLCVKVKTLLHQISVLKEALILDNARLE
jgi:glutaredoxin